MASTTTETKKYVDGEVKLIAPTISDYLSNPAVVNELNRLRIANTPLQIAESVERLIGILRTDMAKPNAVAYDQGLLTTDEWEDNLSAKKSEELKMWGELFDSIIPETDLPQFAQFASIKGIDVDSSSTKPNASAKSDVAACDDLMFAQLVTAIYCLGHCNFRDISMDLVISAAYDYSSVYSRQLWDQKYSELSIWQAQVKDASTTGATSSAENATICVLPHPRQQYALPLYWWSRQKKSSKIVT